MLHRHWLKTLAHLMCCACLAAMLPIAMAADQITWGKYNVPPYMIRSGEFAHQGIFDLTLNVLKKEMPGYEHVELEAPFPRINSETVSYTHLTLPTN